MITEIITSIFNSILKQEEIYLNNNIEQLSEFRKDIILNENQLKLFANHNSIQSLKDIR